MKNFTLIWLLSICLLVGPASSAAVPSQTDFDTQYFLTNALPISLAGNLTNWSKLATNTFAPTASPAFTGNPTVPTASPGDNDTSAASTAFVAAAVTAGAPTAANPPGTVSSSAVNGVAATFMRSDAAPALSAVGTAGTYRSVTTGADGRVTSGTNPTTFSGYGLSDTSANFFSSITDETGGTGVVVGNVSPTINTSLTVTNAATGTTPLTINDASGSSGARLIYNMGGVQKFAMQADGAILGPPAGTMNIAAGTSQNLALLASGGQISLGTSTVVPNASDFTFQNNSSSLKFGNGDLVMTRDAAAVLQLGTDATTATAQAIKAHDGAGTDKAGASLTLEGGQSTGTGTPGDLIERVANKGTASSSTAQAYTTAKVYHANPVTLTESSATLVFNVTLAAGKSITFDVVSATRADDATDFQNASDRFIVTAVNKAGTITFGTGSTGGIKSYFTDSACSSGTLATTWTAVANGNSIDVKNSAVSSLTQTTLNARVDVEVISNDAATFTGQ